MAEMGPLLVHGRECFGGATVASVRTLIFSGCFISAADEAGSAANLEGIVKMNIMTSRRGLEY